TSIFSMTGAFAKSSGALAISAAATFPERCACRPASSGKASKMPKVEGPMRMANHAIVAGSCSTMARPPRRKLSTSLSLPAFASRRTYKPTFSMRVSPQSRSLLVATECHRPTAGAFGIQEQAGQNRVAQGPHCFHLPAHVQFGKLLAQVLALGKIVDPYIRIV